MTEKLKLALIENETDLLDFQSKSLDSFGECRVFKTGEEFLEELSRGYSPQIVLCDLRLEKVDGLNVLEEMKRIGCEAKFVLITGYYNSAIERRAEDLGVERVIEKPFNMARLKSEIKKLLKIA